jgi:hypothetical protein
MSAELKNVDNALNAFAKYVIARSRYNLTKQKKNSSGALYDSLEYVISYMPNATNLKIFMEDYGEFQDKGVSGIKKKFNTPYSYRDKMPPPSKLDRWIVRKGIAPRDDKGRFLNRKSLQFAIARSIYNNGIRPSLFFTKPFEKAFSELPQKLEDAFVKDLENQI